MKPLDAEKALKYVFVLGSLVFGIIWSAVSYGSDFPNEVVRFEILASPPDQSGGIDEISQDSLIYQTQNGFQIGAFPSWIPNGSSNKPIPPDCLPYKFEQNLLQNNQTGEDLQRKLHQYFAKCEASLAKLRPKSLGAAVSLLMAQYNFWKNPLIRPVRIYLQTGEVVQGALALKSGQKKYPLVLVKCGIFCDAASDATVRIVLMHLFDESPFHVLMVGNQTGEKNIRSNHRVTLGGFYEALEFMAIGKWLKQKSPFKEKISDLHALGISLGGNAAVFASLYNDYNRLKQEKIFDSLVAYCPVVRLKPTVEYLFGESIIEPIASKLLWHQLLANYPFVPDLHDLINPEDDFKNVNLVSTVGRLALSYLSRFGPNDFVEPFRGEVIDSEKKFWQVNDYANYMRLVRETPMLVWGSKNDPLVKNSLNTGYVESHSGRSLSENIYTLNLPYGSHCANTLSYGWKTTSSVLRSYFLLHSPNYIGRHHVFQSPLSVKSAPMDSSDVHVYQTWKASSSQNHLELNLYKYSRFNDFIDWDINCSFTGSFDSKTHCYEREVLKVSYDQLPFKLGIPATDIEAQVLTRWLNNNLVVLGTDGEITGTRDSIRGLQWVSN